MDKQASAGISLFDQATQAYISQEFKNAIKQIKHILITI